MIIITVLSYWISVLLTGHVFVISRRKQAKTNKSCERSDTKAIPIRHNTVQQAFPSWVSARPQGPAPRSIALLRLKQVLLCSLCWLATHRNHSRVRAASADTTRSSALDASSFLVDAGFWTDQIVSLCLWKCLVCILHILCGSDR